MNFHPVVMLLLGSVLTFAASMYWYKVNSRARSQERRNEEFSKMLQRQRELETQIAIIGQAVQPISMAFQAMLIKELTHFHTPVMDALMARVGPPSLLTEAEEEELSVALRQRAEDPSLDIPQSERDAALMLPFVMRRAKAEIVVQNSLPEMKLVAISNVSPVNGV